MASAIELYQRAYNLDYRQGDWEEAEDIYKEIVERYPYSDEKEYAQVHLERIQRLKGNPSDPELQPVRSGSAVGLTVFSFFLTLLLIVGTGFLGYFFWQHQNRDVSLELVVQGILSERVGSANNAQLKYEQAIKEDPGNILAHQSLAELFLKHGDKTRAETAGRNWALVSPSDVNLIDFKKRLSAFGTKE